MNKLIRRLAKEAALSPSFEGQVASIKTFADLIVKECMAQCLQEWYDVNNDPVINAETDPRMIGIKIGIKQGALKCKARIAKHFGSK
jgi:hypothetical protein